MRLEEIARAKALDCDTIEIWFADEARVGQKNKITRRWAKRGTRPSAPRDQRTASTYIFGAVCPKEGKGAALIMPACNTEAMNLHLAEIAATVAPAAHAILLVDQAGWRLSTRLLVPVEVPRAQPGRERLAVHARQLALQPHLQILRRSRRPLLCGMEQARRPALAHHVHRTAPMGPRVLINGIWYNSAACLRNSSTSPAPHRVSIRTLRPSVQPSSWSPCRNAAMRGADSGSSAARFMSTP